VRIILVYLLTRGAQVMSRFRGQGASEKSKHVRTIIVLLAQPLPSCVTAAGLEVEKRRLKAKLEIALP
jgi:hypothetical protein